MRKWTLRETTYFYWTTDKYAHAVDFQHAKARLSGYPIEEPEVDNPPAHIDMDGGRAEALPE